MEIRDLRYLLAIAECSSLPRAAESLGVTRQAVDKALRQLEKRAGVVLFERRAGELVPTEECRALLADARDVVQRFDDLCLCHLPGAVAPGGRSGDAGSLDVAQVVACGDALPPRLFETYLTVNPGVNLTVEEMTSDMVLASVAEGRSDVGILGSHPELLDGFDCCLIRGSGIWVVVGADSPLASKAGITLADLSRMPLVTPGRHNHVHRFVQRRCAAAGLELDVRASSTLPDVLGRFIVEEGAACFGFPPAMSATPPGMTAVRLIVEGNDEFGTYAVRRPLSGMRRRQAAQVPRMRAMQLFWDLCRALRCSVEGAR